MPGFTVHNVLDNDGWEFSDVVTVIFTAAAAHADRPVVQTPVAVVARVAHAVDPDEVDIVVVDAAADTVGTGLDCGWDLRILGPNPAAHAAVATVGTDDTASLTAPGASATARLGAAGTAEGETEAVDVVTVGMTPNAPEGDVETGDDTAVPADTVGHYCCCEEHSNYTHPAPSNPEHRIAAAVGGSLHVDNPAVVLHVVVGDAVDAAVEDAAPIPVAAAMADVAVGTVVVVVNTVAAAAAVAVAADADAAAADAAAADADVAAAD